MSIWPGQWTRVELIAACYYEELGYEVIRLVHQALALVREDFASRVPGAVQTRTAMQRVLPPDVYAVWFDCRPRKTLALDMLYPEDYPLTGYVPDFLVSRPGDWRLVEVKGPGDTLHSKQANWLINLRPESWLYEVCAPIEGLAEPLFVNDPIAKSSGFDAMIAVWRQEVDDSKLLARIRARCREYFNARDALKALPQTQKGSAHAASLKEQMERGREKLIAAEDHHATVYTRFWRRLYLDMANAAFNRHGEWVLASGRPISDIDPNWPPTRRRRTVSR